MSETPESKTCSSCKRDLPASSFHRQAAKPDRLHCYCRQCSAIKSHLRWKVTFHHQSEQRKAWRAKNKAKVRAYAKEQALKEPHKAKARQACRGKIKSGEIQKLPCRECGSKNSQAHHDDYSKPFDVIFLCPKHHSELHNNRRLQSAIANEGKGE